MNMIIYDLKTWRENFFPSEDYTKNKDEQKSSDFSRKASGHKKVLKQSGFSIYTWG